MLCVKGSVSVRYARNCLLDSTAIVLGLVVLAGPSPAFADQLTWNPGGADPSEWDTTTAVWDNGLGGGNVAFAAGDNAIFNGLADTIAVTEDVNSAGLSFGTTGFVIQSATAADTIVFGALPGGVSSTLDVATASGGSATITSILAFRNTVVVNGEAGSSGTLVLSGANVDGGAPVAATIDVRGGGLTIAAGGAIAAEDTVENNGGIVTIAGTLGGALINNSGQTQNQNSVAGPVTVADGAFANRGSVQGSVAVNGTGTFTNNVSGSITNTTITIDDDGVFDANGGSFANGTTVTVNSGDLNVTANLNTVTTGVTLDNIGGTVTVGNGATLTTDLAQTGATTTVAAGGRLTDTNGSSLSGGVLNNNGTITNGVAVTGGQLNNTGAVNGTATVSGAGQLIATGGSFGNAVQAQSDGEVIIEGDVAGDIVNNGGTVVIRPELDGGGDPTGQLGNLTGSLTNNSGTATIQTGGTLTGPLTITGDEATSTVNVAGVIQQNAAGDQVTVTDGTLNIQDGADIQIAIVQDNANASGVAVLGASGGAINLDGGAFSGGLTGHDGVIAVNGATAGDVTVAGSDFDINAGGGDLTGTVTVTTAADITAQNSGTLNGRLNANGGIFENNGLIQRLSDPSGDAVVIDGGTLNNNAGDITAGTRLEQGVLRALGGSFSGGVVVNEDVAGTSQFRLETNTTGDVTNNSTLPTTGDGAVVFDAGTSLIGDLTNQSGLATLNGRIIGQITLNDGRVVTNDGSQVDQSVDVTGGQFVANGGTFVSGVNATGGRTDILGAITVGADSALVGDGGVVVIDRDALVTGNVAAANSAGAPSGSVTNNGLITGAVSVGTITETTNGSSFLNAGDITETVTVNNGSFSITSGTIAGTATVGDNGSFIASGGTFDSGVTNTGGTVRIEDDAQGNVINIAGSAAVLVGAVLTGDVSNSAGAMLDLRGAIAGSLANDGGVVNAIGTVLGATTNRNTDANTTSQIFVPAGQTANFVGGLSNSNGGVVAVQGTLNGAFDNLADGALVVGGGSLTGTFTNAGEVRFLGSSQAEEAINNNGQMTVGDDTGAADRLDVAGTLMNSASGTLTLTEGATLSATAFMNEGNLNLSGTLDAALTNNSQISQNNAAFGGLVTNASDGRIILSEGSIPDDADMMIFGAGLVNNGIVDASSGSGNEGDMIQINGPLSGTGMFVLDVDLSEDNSGTDGVQVSGPVTGTVILDFNILGTNGRQDEDLKVFDVDGSQANNFTYELRNLPDQGEAIVYVPLENSEGDLLIQDALNPGIGALAGSIVLTQSLIGSVINRPSSPFVTGIAFDDPDPCGAGLWVRGISGKADSSGMVTELTEDGSSFEGEISASYYGYQAGGDIACFNGYYQGWDLSIGGIAGVNIGATEQPVFGLESGPGGALISGDQLTSVTTVDFTQTYGGLYVTGTRDRLSIDLQYRLETTEFSATNEGLRGSSGLGLNDNSFGSDASTFSGSVSYAIPIGQTALNFVPTAGFAYTQVSTDLISFDDTSSVQVQDFTSETAFVGGTLSRTILGADGTSALSQFATATHYNDFADAPSSIFTPRVDTGQAPRPVVGENLGAYTEFSAGLNYVRVLQPGAVAGAKQISASLRGDYRTSDQLDSLGVTGQFRIQF